MNTFYDATRQQAQDRSRRLGDLAARLQPDTPQTDFPQDAVDGSPANFSTRLPTLLARYLHRNSAQRHEEQKLKANEFMFGD
jgi:hypothetical protein